MNAIGGPVSLQAVSCEQMVKFPSIVHWHKRTGYFSKYGKLYKKKAPETMPVTMVRKARTWNFETPPDSSIASSMSSAVKDST